MPTIGVRAISPRKRWPNWKKAERVLRDAMRNEVLPLHLKWHRAIVRNWTGAPTFSGRVIVTRRRLATVISVKGPYRMRWFWTSKGTRPRIIRPKGRYPLRFMRHYFPKTTVFGGFGGPGRSAPPIVRAMVVHHKGTRPRHFEKNIIKKQTDKPVKLILKKAMQRASRAM